MKTRIEEIRLQNFRAFENARLGLSGLTLLVGRNGAGKSSLLDAVEFLREAVTDSLPNALARRGGLDGVRRRGASPGDPMALAVVFRLELPGRTVRVLYGVELRGTQIQEVFVAEGSTAGYVRTNDTLQGENLPSVAVPPHRLVLPLLVSDELHLGVWTALSRMRAYAIAPTVMALPAPIGSSTSLAYDGANTADVLEDVRPDREAHAALVALLGVVVPGIVDVRGSLVAGQRVLEFVQRAAGVDHVFMARQVSQGTLRALGNLVALYQRPEPTLLLLDEIEDSLHLHGLAAILEAVEERAGAFPIVVTTHSTEVLSHRIATPDRIRIVDWRDGVSHLYALSDDTKDSIDAVTTAGDLLRHNGLWAGSKPEVCAGDPLELGP